MLLVSKQDAKKGCDVLSASHWSNIFSNTRRGGSIYDAPEPWGPWTTVFYTENWDVDPGESQHLPTKWMSADGKTLHMVFSGNDSFSVRQATLSVTREATVASGAG
jgi:hypothetical protein